MTDQSGLDYQFDTRVAEQYDVIRGHPAEVSDEIGRAIAAQMPEAARVLELGVGTGRIALPVAAAGCEVYGIDVSAHMLAWLSRRIATEGRDNIHLARGDITALPFREGAFDGAMAVHVLHLVADWADVLEQVSRLVRPGGMLVLGRDWIDPESFSGTLRNTFRRTVVEVGTEMLPPGATAAAPPSGGAAIVKTLMDLGAHPVGEGEVIGAEWQTELTPRQVLDGIRSRDDAESWVLPDDVLTETMRRLDAFAEAQWPDLDAELPVTRRFMLGVFRFGDRARA
ncbi:class I SAM-dependent methyltransferase [Wenzhouxiangella sp. XN79A]|uniref:class I SAM-dependent methyltransferase n=1 Tax=Wenzhouxiangella sp. XN79A TaxID=2724193 RepID=UPI00144A689F|nr:class I SAM-dependent methyltransferase [Wenzhouxiangella sp. XN79A]NKI34876.1 class I SAM-dependent methyltransferase [Wenzhouxiangella sp. XN79A]